MAGNKPLTLCGEAIAEKEALDLGKNGFRGRAETKAPQKRVNAKSEISCSTCGRKFRSKRRRKAERAFCSPRCRLLFWAAGEILEEWKAGRADGLRDLVRELAAPAEEGR